MRPSRNAPACPSASGRSTTRPRRTTCRPPPAPAKAGDDPPEEAYEHCPWAVGGGPGDENDSGDSTIDDDRADGAEHDWLHQRRYGYDEIYDPWAPEEREERRRNRLEREERRRAAEEFDFDDDDDDFDDDDDDRDDGWTGDGGFGGGEDGPEDGEFAPDHDIA